MHNDERSFQPFCATRDDVAPLFSAPALVGRELKKLSLEDCRGKWVVLFFYPSDFTFV
ncbi:redoxin domain-containing protein [Ammoniphilus sp. CFH 90114]|nr:redoxin domain-containing protein [Ammoniphilus sp. CFH 90114]